MKKIFVLITLFSLLSINSSFAQGITSKGFTAGLNLANVSGKNIKNNSMKIGFAVGAFLTYSVNHQIAVRPEIYYSTKGFTTSQGEGSFTTSLNYIDIPILGVYKINRNINIFAGPYIDIFLSGNYKIEIGEYNTSGDIKSKDMATPGFGLAFGGEYNLNKIKIGARYNLGLSNVSDSTEDLDKYTHSVIQILVGFAL